jgi:hypothetical protein
MAGRYTLGGRPVNPSMDAMLGNGGQANVIELLGKAVKWWKSPNSTQIKKVEYLLKNPPALPTDKFLFPTDPFRDERDRLAGYGMDKLPGNFREGGVLFNKTLRKRLNINVPTMLAVMDSHRDDLENLHRSGIVLGDESGRNFAFVIGSKGAKTFCYDTDAYVVAGYPCPVWTEWFLCPDLYRYTGGKQNVPFSETSDWYGFATILFWSLFYTNQYQQIHVKYDDFRDKAERGLWLLDSQVTYPKGLCPHPDTVSDNLLHYFELQFKKHKFQPVSHQDLVDYASNLVQCTSCDSFYPNNRPSCPSCSVKTPAVEFSPDHSYSKLIGTRGPILFAKFQSGTLYVVSREKSGYFLHIRPGKGQTVSSLIPLDQNENYRFDIVGSEHLVVNPVDDESLYVAPVSDLENWLTTNTSQYLGNRQSVFRGTGSGLFRTAGSQLMLGVMRNGYLVEDAMPIQLPTGQSWLWAETSGKRLLTMSRSFSVIQYELLIGNNRYEVPVSNLEDFDSMTDIVVMFGSNLVCVRRMVIRKGRSMILTDVFDDFGDIVFSSSHLVSKLPVQDIHKATFEDGKVFWPTDQGIIVETLKTNAFEVIKNTEKLVNADDKLIHLGSGSHFLVVHENKVNYLVL